MNNIKHQMGRILRTIIIDGKIDNRTICDLTHSTTPSRRVADLRAVFGDHMKKRTGRSGYAEFVFDDDTLESLRWKWIQLCEDYSSDAECRIRLWKWAKSKQW